MLSYRVPLVPGPVSVPVEVLAAYQHDYGSADLEDEFFGLYAEAERQLQSILGTTNRVAIMSGEAMVVLWGALKSCLRPRDRVLVVATGLFGYGFADMAGYLRADVHTVGFDYDEAADPARVNEALASLRPKMVLLVHCETPSGTLNPAAEIGELARRHGVALYCVDAVSSAGGAPLRTDEWGIDLCLVGTQKCL